ncbi:MAG: hypothetical protein V3U72_00965 [Candidatus Aenigmarchaeota archaeon]
MEKDKIEKTIKGNDVILFLLPNNLYYEKIKEIARIVSKLSKRVCYVTLNKPHETLLKDFKRDKIVSSGFFFIDCVTKKEGKKAKERVNYVSSPKALTEMNIAMKKALTGGRIDSTIFDSLSTLLVYEGSHAVVRFAHSIVSMFRALGTKGILISLKEDIQSQLVIDLGMFVDKVVELG